MKQIMRHQDTVGTPTDSGIMAIIVGCKSFRLCVREQQCSKNAAVANKRSCSSTLKNQAVRSRRCPRSDHGGCSGFRLQTSDKRTAPSDRTICFGPRCKLAEHKKQQGLTVAIRIGRFFQEECSSRYGMCMCACAQNAERESGVIYRTE